MIECIKLLFTKCEDGVSIPRTYENACNFRAQKVEMGSQGKLLVTLVVLVSSELSWEILPWDRKWG